MQTANKNNVHSYATHHATDLDVYAGYTIEFPSFCAGQP